MKWSQSGARAFLTCPRRWYFQTFFANSIAKSPQRNEAMRLKRLVNLRAWRGRIVDEVISNHVVPGLRRKASPNLGEMLQIAGKLIERDLPTINAGSEQHPSLATPTDPRRLFLETEYGIGLNSLEVAAAKSDIQIALGTFAESTVYADLRDHATLILAQRSLSFHYGELAVQAVPDVIAFYDQRPPAIIDWKVQEPRYRQAPQQLILYGVALQRAKPHKDFPAHSIVHLKNAGRVNLVEAQLLRNEEILYHATSDDVTDLVDYIFTTGSQMLASFEGKPSGTVSADEFPTARDPASCASCNFKKICWVEAAS